MSHCLRRTLCLLLMVLLLLPALPSLAEVASSPYPPLDAQGYLLDSSPGAEFVYEDEALGLWCYLSGQLRVDITRHQGMLGRRQAVWFVADIHARDGVLFRSYSAAPEKPGSKKARTEDIAGNNGVVYAQNADLWTWRLDKGRYPGVIIRDGQLIKNRTYRKQVNALPSLDELALYPDGRFEVHAPGELSGQDYLDRGAYDVFSFGPVLIRDGVMDDRLVKSFRTAQPRSAIGMVAPGHYVGVVVEGRTTRSHGSNLEFLAQVLLDHGCQLGFNLDGGQTVSMAFMGKHLLLPGGREGTNLARRLPDIIGIGLSPLTGNADD